MQAQLTARGGAQKFIETAKNNLQESAIKEYGKKSAQLPQLDRIKVKLEKATINFSLLTNWLNKYAKGGNIAKKKVNIDMKSSIESLRESPQL